jgi:transposase
MDLLGYIVAVVCLVSLKLVILIKTQLIKTQKHDSRIIADALRCKYYNEVHQKEQNLVELKMMLKVRSSLMKISLELKNSIRGHLKIFGVRLPSLSNAKFYNEVQKILSLQSNMVKESILPLLQSFMNINEQLASLDRNIRELGKNDEDVKLLTTIPGIGVIIALTFKVLIGDPKRFKKSKTVGAYFGMTPKQDSSGETVFLGRISKCGSNDMRALINEGATSLLYKAKTWSTLKIWGLKLVRKKGHKKACMAVGRKLCVIMHRMLITRKPFECCEQPKEDFTPKSFRKFSPPKEKIKRMKEKALVAANL